MENLIDPGNPIVQLCADGMLLEGEGKAKEAAACFLQAWEQSVNDRERFIAAHYVARHQSSIDGKLSWDITALELAMTINDDAVKGAYPSLYLNIAKGYEELEQTEMATEYYNKALSVIHYLQDDGYGKMIRSGVEAGLKRTGFRTE